MKRKFRFVGYKSALNTVGKYLSIIATSRNDNHGGDMTKRMRIFVNGLIAQCNKYNIDAELIMVEWNPPKDRQLLKDELPQPKPGDKLSLRYIIVPKEIHDQYVHAPSIPLFQMTAKNVGIRRAEGEFILCTNIDLLFSDELFEWIAKNKLQKGAYYRAPRADVPRDISEDWPLQQQLDWCKKNILVKWGYNSRFLNLVGFPNWVFRIKFLPELLNILVGPLRQWKDPLNYQISKLDYNACGDFTLMSKQDWEKIEGYVELDLYSIHIDSMALNACIALGIEQIILPYPCTTFHIHHEEGWASMEPLQVLKFLSKRPGMDWGAMHSAGRYIITHKTNYGINQPNWGFVDKQLEEYRFN